MNIEVQSVLYISILFLISSVIASVVVKIMQNKVNEKIRVIILWSFMFIGSIYISFFLLGDQDFLLKYYFPLLAFLFLVYKIIELKPSGNKKIKKIFEEENEWKERAFKNK